MKAWKAYVCSFVFAALTAAKLLAPDHCAQLRERVLEMISRDDDYTQLVETMGRELADGGLRDRIVAALGIKTGAGGGVALSAMDEEKATPSPAAERAPAAPEKENTVAAEPEAVSAFLAEQAKFVGYRLPDDVRTDMPELPFEYASPVAAAEPSGFGFRLHPIKNRIMFHYGTDFAAGSGEEVSAFADGSVFAAGTDDSYGNYLILMHEGGYSTLYAHLSAFSVSEGDAVKKGQLVGRVGQTGSATGPHLHFELLLDGEHINPEYYV